MHTSKDISNISYNTPEFLEATLNKLKYKGIIDFWIFIEHKPEMEEDHKANRKRHIHLMFRPSKMIQTHVIEKEFYEFDPTNEKPLKCTDDWRPVNSFGDWWLYSLHDKAYLQHKGEVREFHYSIEDVHCSDKDTLERLISFIDFGSLYRIEKIAEAAKRGIPYSRALAMGLFGENPNKYILLYKALLTDQLTKGIAEQRAYMENLRKES